MLEILSICMFRTNLGVHVYVQNQGLYVQNQSLYVQNQVLYVKNQDYYRVIALLKLIQ